MLTTRARYSYVAKCVEFVATSPLAATLVQEVPADSGKLPWYMTDSTALQLQ